MKTNKQNVFLELKRIIFFMFTALYLESCKSVIYIYDNLLDKQKIYIKLNLSKARFLYNR